MMTPGRYPNFQIKFLWPQCSPHTQSPRPTSTTTQAQVPRQVNTPGREPDKRPQTAKDAVQGRTNQAEGRVVARTRGRSEAERRRGSRAGGAFCCR